MTAQTISMKSYILFCLLSLTFQSNLIEEDQLLELNSGFSEDFQSFLSESGYKSWEFNRPEITDSCYGGFEQRPSQQPSKNPVIFIHGNSDTGFGKQGRLTGARKLFEYLTTYGGYSKGELYVFTWGDGKATSAASNYHSRSVLSTTRAFVEAVLQYTKASKVNIVSHSMGVTIARKVVKGGRGHDALNGGEYNLGSPLTSRVNIFLGIAGGNLGLSDCLVSPIIPTCGMTNGLLDYFQILKGFYPGNPALFISKSDFLSELDENPAKEGSSIISMWSHSDEIIKYDCLVYGKYTTRIRGQDQEFTYTTQGHFQLRDNVEVIYEILKGNQVALKPISMD